LVELLHLYSLVERVQFFKLKFRHNEIIHVLKSSNYFYDADFQTDPTSLKNQSWHTIKDTISQTLKSCLEEESKKIIL